MATFRHARYPSLLLHDGEHLWAQFVDGVLETNDAEVVKRLRAATDPDLTEDKPTRAKKSE